MTETHIREAITSGVIEGSYAPAFEGVYQVFRQNFEESGEQGAAICVSVGGETVVDLWGGVADPKTAAPWQNDTVAVVFSCTKAATALAAHLLADRGALDLDAPVALIWPEFTAAGKEGVTMRMLLDHTAGLPALRTPLKPDCLLDWGYMTSRLAAEAPFWEPGTRSGYHAITFGYLVGEVVRRVSGQSLGAFFQEEIARPLRIDFWIGLPESEEPRVAPITPYRFNKDDEEPPFIRAARTKGSIANLFIFNHGDWMARGVNTRAGRAAEIGAAGGITNGRGLCGMFEALLKPGGPLGLSAKTLAGFSETSSATHMDATLQMPTRFGPGFMHAMDNRRRPGGGDSVILGPKAFGHVGAGGSLGFADPDAGMAFGYVMSRQGPGLLLNERGQRLVDAAYGALGISDS
ncbi:beta-lactamase family protein [Alphaproteobacteria bacterium]|jgi:CubicO group peptidase (beta-lactamase class C family)|nr:beta-lactamase family protein [Alphaproteobacteria bacterium]